MSRHLPSRAHHFDRAAEVLDPRIELALVEPQIPPDPADRQAVLADVAVEGRQGGQAEIDQRLLARQIGAVDRARLLLRARVRRLEATLAAHAAAPTPAK